RFGTILSDITTRSTYRLSFRGFIVERDSPLRLNIATLDSLHERLDSVKQAGSSYRHVDRISGPAYGVALRLRSDIPPLACEDARPRDTTVKFGTRFHEAISLHGLFANVEINPQLAANKPYEGIDIWAAELIKELEIAYNSIE